jgi:hypothetical protein
LLMEHFLRIDTTPREWKYFLAACLRWLRVPTIADIADERGTEIPGGHLTGEWRAEPCFEWPHQPRPGKRAWAMLCCTLRETLCFKTSPWQPTNAAMKLSHPLGPWLEVLRHVQYQCYQNDKCLFWREEDMIQMFRQQGRIGFFRYVGEVDSIPPRTHPQSCVWADQSLWTQRTFNLQNPPEVQTLPPGQVISNTISKENAT